MAFWNRRDKADTAEDGEPSIVIVSLGGREDLLPDFAFPVSREGDTTIGREESCAIQVVDGQISRQHMAIRFDPERGRFTARDLESANGTFVNEVRLDREVLIGEGDVIRIGDSRLLFTGKRFKDHGTAMTYYRRTGERRKGTLMK